MKCCASCFGDRVLRKEIIRPLSNETGTCSYCKTKNEHLVTPNKLSEYFGLVIGIYRPDKDGRPIVEWLREDWALFDPDNMDDAHAKELLADILDDGEIVRKTFVPSESYQTDRLDRWKELRDELLYKNRFFPATELDSERLGTLLTALILDTDEILAKWYRARIQADDTAFDIGEMGAPPKRTASHGRANPAGIPYLYLASKQITAISEIRPHTGEIVSVADFSIVDDLKIVDLRNPRKSVSPFIVADEQNIGSLRGDIEFLESLGEELTRPVLPQSAAIDYVPSQYLCEFIKKCRYDGVTYRSSVSDGINLALFDPARAEPGTVTQHRVSRVSVDVE